MWLKPQGHAEIINPDDGGLIYLDHIRTEVLPTGTSRMDTCTCYHCGFVFHVSARQRPEDIGGLCKSCMQPICPKCLDGPCTPLLKQLDEIENKMHRKLAVDGYF